MEKVFVSDFPEILSMQRECMIRKDKCTLDDTENPFLVPLTSKAQLLLSTEVVLHYITHQCI